MRLREIMNSPGYIQSGWTAEGDEAFSIRERLRRLREKLLNHWRETFGKSSPLFEAILLGDRNNMDDEIVNAMPPEQEQFIC